MYEKNTNRHCRLPISICHKHYLNVDSKSKQFKNHYVSSLMNVRKMFSSPVLF